MKISVVITVLNEGKTIEKLLKSLFNQTKSPDEIIVVDGGSSDRTVAKIKNLKLKIENDNVKFKILVKHGNRAVGRNYGIAQAKNEIIAVTDAGGYPKKDWLEKITAPFNNKTVQAVSGYYKSVAETSFEKCITPYFLVMPDALPKDGEFLPSSRSIAFRKSVWKKVGGYPEQFSHNEDLVFDYNLKKAGISFFFEPNAKVYWYPPQNLFLAAKQFFRFAYGDAQAGIKRSKVPFIFIRYGIALLLLGAGAYPLLFLLIFLYGLWVIWRHFKYVMQPNALFWLPIIQVTADFAIMSGTLIGKIQKRGTR